MFKKIAILFFFTFLCFSLFSRKNDIDSLINILNTSEKYEQKTDLIYQISDYYYKKNEFTKAQKYLQEGILLSKKNNDTKNELRFSDLNARSYLYLSEYDKSLEEFRKLLKIAENTDNEKYIGLAYTGYLKNYWRLGNYEKAIFYADKAVKIFDKTEDIYNKNAVLLNCANIYIDIKDYKSAEKTFDLILNDSKNFNDTLLIASIYEKKGVISFFKSMYPLARKYYSEAHRLYILKGDSLSAAIQTGNTGETYEKEGKYAKALQLYKYAAKIEEKYNYYSGLIFLYEALGRTYGKTGKYNKIAFYYKKALSLIEKTGEKRELPNIYGMLHTLYAKTGNYKKAYEFSLKLNAIKDSLTGENVQNQLNTIKIKYETEKTEKENEILRIKETAQKKQNRRQFFIIIFISGFLIFVIIFSVLLFRLYRKNKKIRQILSVKNDELSEAYSEIKHSIDYAGKIQLAMLSTYTEILKSYPEFIILYKPVSTLSGDFYWSKIIKDTIYTVAADSTGHGIPGALLSITGMSFLNEIVTEDFIRPDVILNNLRTKIKHRLNQTGNFYEQKDGWDMSVFSFNFKTFEGNCAGAFNSIYVVTEKNNKKELEIYKADRQPVAVFHTEKPFTNHRLHLKKGDIIWMFTDGFIDQFNEIVRKKYSTKRLRKLLLSISDKTLSEQKNILVAEFKIWKGDFEQIDDILIMGIRI